MELGYSSANVSIDYQFIALVLNIFVDNTGEHGFCCISLKADLNYFWVTNFKSVVCFSLSGPVFLQ